MRAGNRYYCICGFVLSLLFNTSCVKAQTFRYFDALMEANAKYINKKYDTAAKLYDLASVLAPKEDKPMAFFNAARCWALLGNKEKAFNDLTISIDCGFSDFTKLETDTDFTGIYDDSRWKITVQKMGALYSGREKSYYWGMYFGLLFILFFYNLFLFISLRDITFLYYSIIIFFLVNFEIWRTNDFGAYLPRAFMLLNYSNWIHFPVFSLFISIATIFYLLLVRKFMRLKEVLPTANKILLGLITLMILNIVLVQANLIIFIMSKVSPITIFVSYIICFIVGILLWIKGHKHVRYFVLACSVLSLSMLLLILDELGVGDFNIHIKVFRPDNIGTMAFVGLLSFALADRINILKKEKEGAQEKALEVLEEKVQERTLEIEEQKELVEEKQKDILDSITYAKRLQDAILPPVSFIKKFLPDSFLVYKPKDIVAGDFYWMERSDDNILIAAADCTGHGVPGALVSVVCSNALNRTVKEFHITEPGKILDKVRELVLETFEKSESNVQDGMDISLCCITTKTKEVQWSGAYNSLWYIQKGEIKEVAADKQPIGKNDRPEPFNTHKLNLQKGDTLYLFTDGYADQFGGPKGKKFKYKQMEELLLANASKPMDEQKDVLENTLEKWKGTLEQVDDILIIGIRV